MTTFAVAGEASKSHPAERGTVRITVSATGADRKRVRADSIAAHAALTTEAAAHQAAGAVTEWTADRVSTATTYEPGDAGHAVGYRASASATVVFSDLAALADWISDLGGRAGIDIEGITWSLSEPVHSRLMREVRIEAILDAIARANDYAAALDRGSPSLDAVYEDGLRPHVGGGSGFARGAMAMRVASLDAGSYVLKPGDIEVVAAISADFSL